MAIDAYTGVDNLEVMEVAVSYRRFLAQMVAGAAGPPRPGLRLLDFGAGSGTHALALTELGYDVTCVEPDESLRRNLGHRGLAAHASLADLGDRRFDTVYTLNVLEHIDDDLGALREMHGVTAPGGTFVVYVPAFQVLYSAMDRKVGHLRRYRHGLMTQRAEAAGFEVVSCRYADSLGFPATLLYRAVGSRKGDINERSVAAYDRLAFPASLVLDRVVGRWLGKNLVLVARRPPDGGRAS